MNTQVQVEATKKFFDVSRSIAEKFIQTVVAVDDKITFGVSQNNTLEEPIQVVVPSQDISGIGEIVQEQASSVISESINNQDSNELNYQELSESFAEKSILCTALKTFNGVDGEEKTIKATLNLAKKADITILDWQMENDATRHGKIAKGVIEQLLAHDVSNNGRLRLILVYTSELVSHVLRALEAGLTSFGASIQEDKEIIFDGQNLSLCKIVVINKQLETQGLVNQSINEFTHMTCGLLSNATLAAITEIRDRTHHHLYKFNKNLDTAYISHILGLVSSKDMRESSYDVAFDYAVELISEELKSNLQISKIVKDSLDSKSLEVWPQHVNPSDQIIHSIIVGDRAAVKFNNDRMERFLTVKDEEALGQVLSEEPAFHGSNIEKKLSNFASSTIQFELSQSSEQAHLELSAIECLRRDIVNNTDVNPVLKQGTILKQNENYFVCIQPICDSVRLEDNTNFLFLKAEKVGEKKFSHVLRVGNNEYKTVKFKPLSKFVCLMTFSPENKMIRAEKNNDKFIFKSVNGENFEWCGEFKQAIYQEIVNAVSGSIARVGFDSFEWLRLRKS